MAATPNLPLSTNLFGSNSEDSKKDDKKSPLDELRDVKKYVDNIRSTIKYARLATSPVLLGPVIGIALVLIIMIFFDSGTAGGLTGGGGGGNNTTKPGTNPSTPIIPGFDIDIEGPPEKENDIILDYTVTITHDPSIAPPIENIEVYDTLPAGAELVETSGFVVDKNASPHVWPLSNTSNQKIFTIRIRPNTTDANFYYTVSARTIAGPTGSSGTNVPPSNSDCGGKYAQTFIANGNQENFGDPVCDYTEDKLYDQLKKEDPENADVWYYLAYCESSVNGVYRNPNAYLMASTSGSGAYGLYQMNPAGKSTSGPNDVGNVVWSLNATNAILTNRHLVSIGLGPFAYWQRSPSCPWWTLL